MATSHDALRHLVDVCRSARNLDACLESAAALGAGDTLYNEIAERLGWPEHGLPRSVIAAFREAQEARK